MVGHSSQWSYTKLTMSM